jgi:hypothetical protein
MRARWVEDPLALRLVFLGFVLVWGGASWIALRIPFVLGAILFALVATGTLLATIWMIRRARELARGPRFGR